MTAYGLCLRDHCTAHLLGVMLLCSRQFFVCFCANSRSQRVTAVEPQALPFEAGSQKRPADIMALSLIMIPLSECVRRTLITVGFKVWLQLVLFVFQLKIQQSSSGNFAVVSRLSWLALWLMHGFIQDLIIPSRIGFTVLGYQSHPNSLYLNLIY